jgi:hypothetical protein
VAVGDEPPAAGKEAWCGSRVGGTATTLAWHRQSEDSDAIVDLAWPGRQRWDGSLPQQLG